MLMGMGGGSSNLAVFSKIDNQAGSYYVHQFAWGVICQASCCTVFRRLDRCQTAGSVRRRPCAHHPTVFLHATLEISIFNCLNRSR
jgi:hypothetical protein